LRDVVFGVFVEQVDDRIDQLLQLLGLLLEARQAAALLLELLVQRGDDRLSLVAVAVELLFLLLQ
jgi:hypothetical protein